MEIIIIVSLVVGVLILHRSLSEIFNKFYVRRQQRKFIANETFYHSIVSRYIRFYNKLGLEDQRKFLLKHATQYYCQMNKRYHLMLQFLQYRD